MTKPRAMQLGRQEFRLFQELMYDRAGVRLGPAKHALVQNRLRKRIAALGLSSYRAYFDYVSDPARSGELQQCIDRLTTNETYFFRHKHHWDFFTRVFLPERKRRDDEEIRVWSAAASTGAEAYSAAIALYDGLRDEPTRRFVVDATDINGAVIEEAKRGEYGDYALQKLTAACRRTYFVEDPETGRLRVVDAVRGSVRFSVHNLMTPRRGVRCDIVFLRNVLIYFDEASKAVVLDHVTRALRPGGYLVLGGAESLSARKDAYEYIRPTIYRKRREDR